MKKTTINGKEYFYKMTISACKKFKNQLGIDVVSIDEKDVEQLLWSLFLGLEAGTNIQYPDTFDLKIEDLEVFDIPELCKHLLAVNPKVDDKKKL